MAEVVPAINATNPAEFKQMLGRVEPFAKRIHVDICDGQFGELTTVGLAQVYGLKDVPMDLHLMLQKPGDQFETAVSLKPSLIIYHFESDGDLADLIRRTQELKVKAGLAILPETKVEQAAELIAKVDHVMIFTGRLSYNAGDFKADQLAKVGPIKDINPQAEISVDGGVNEGNVALSVAAGIDVLYAGSAIQRASDPKAAFQALSHIGVHQ